MISIADIKVSLGAQRGAISRGDLLLARLSDAARLAADRRYLPTDVPVVKQVAAISGDVDCAESSIVVIDDRVAARTLLMDRGAVLCRPGTAAGHSPRARSSS